MKKTEILNQEVLKEREEWVENRAKQVLAKIVDNIADCESSIKSYQKLIAKEQNKHNKLLEKTPQEIVDDSEDG